MRKRGAKSTERSTQLRWPSKRASEERARCAGRPLSKPFHHFFSWRSLSVRAHEACTHHTHQLHAHLRKLPAHILHAMVAHEMYAHKCACKLPGLVAKQIWPVYRLKSQNHFDDHQLIFGPNIQGCVFSHKLKKQHNPQYFDKMHKKHNLSKMQHNQLLQHNQLSHKHTQNMHNQQISHN